MTNCPNCGEEFVWRRSKYKFKPNQKQFFLKWQYCNSCGYVKHYEEFRRLVPEKCGSEIKKPKKELVARYVNKDGKRFLNGEEVDLYRNSKGWLWVLPVDHKKQGWEKVNQN